MKTIVLALLLLCGTESLAQAAADRLNGNG